MIYGLYKNSNKEINLNFNTVTMPPPITVNLIYTFESVIGILI